MCSVRSVGISVLPQISQICTEVLAKIVLPQISQICTELLAACVLPQISQIYTEIRLSSRGCIRAICGSHFAAAEARIPPLLSSAPNESV